MMACAAGNISIVHVLCQYEANLHIEDISGSTALDHAIIKQHQG